ncbi:sulfatase [Ningiella sp. W23]|uniref:sulfatase family protein n=1 Tax=Ningiella sp. W23 TaxID=3023715 RepID=UPI003757EFF2
MHSVRQLFMFRIFTLSSILVMAACSPLKQSEQLEEASVASAISEQVNDKSDTAPANIVLILTDDQGYADTSLFGQDAYATPNIDSIAEQGAMLTQFYVAQPVCSTSRAALLTGSYPNRIGLAGALFPTPLTDGPAIGLNPDEETLAELLQEQGYATALFGKWHLGDVEEFLPNNHGFDEYYGIPYSNDMWSANANPSYPFDALPVISQNKVVKTLTDDQSNLTVELTEKSVEFIEKNAEQPFFMMLAHPQPHVPLFVSERFRGKSGAGLYGDVIMEIDWSTGEILNALEAQGLNDNTIVIFLADNGPWLTYSNHAGSAGDLRDGKFSVYEGGVRTPMHIKWPARLAANTKIDVPMMSIDLLPTLTKLAGARLPKKEIDGKDIWPIISAVQSTPAHEAYYFYTRENDLSAVRYGDWKLVYPHVRNVVLEAGSDGNRGKDEFPMFDEMQLFNIAKDPGETNNVIDKHPDIVITIEALADKMRAELGDNLRDVKGSENRPIGRLE